MTIILYQYKTLVIRCYKFVKLTLVRWTYRELDGEQFNNRLLDKWNRGLFLTGPEGNTQHVLRIHKERSSQSAEREARPGRYAFIRVHGWSALGFPGYSQISQFSLKELVMVCHMGVSCKGHIRRRFWEAGETAYHKGYWRSRIRYSQFLWLCGLLPRACTWRRRWVSV